MEQIRLLIHVAKHQFLFHLTAGHYDYRVQIAAGKQVSDEARNYTYMTLVGSKRHTGKISLARSSESPSKMECIVYS